MSSSTHICQFYLANGGERMNIKFLKEELLSRGEIWARYHPESVTGKPKGGDWDTGYVREGNELIAFLNIGDIGRTGHDFKNSFDPETETLVWFGKSRSHSSQPTFQKLISGELKPQFFARWKNTNTKFTYLGQGTIQSFQDAVPVGDGKSAIRMIVSLQYPQESSSAESVSEASGHVLPIFAKKTTVIVNRYERDPQKRRECVEHFGYCCQICDFNFREVYGEVGKDFIHVHHIEPLAEVGGEHDIDPKVDLIPVCANCHAIIHRMSPALKPDQVKRLLLR